MDTKLKGILVASSFIAAGIAKANYEKGSTISSSAAILGGVLMLKEVLNETHVTLVHERIENSGGA